MTFSGTFAAVPTPFAAGRVDEDALRGLVRFVVMHGMDGVVACGTTGEAPTLSKDEWTRVVQVCLAEAGGLPVLAGTGTNSTASTVERTRLAREMGAAAALVVSPYYNKPTQEGLKQHFETVARETGLPIVMYNIPGRTGVNVIPETMAALARVPGILGVKEAAGSLDQVSAIVSRCGTEFAVLSGDDSLSLPMYAIGARGVISTTANAAPALMAAIWTEFCAGNVDAARLAHYKLLPLFRALFLETNPAPLKYALSRMGLCANELRLPLVPVTDATSREVDRALAAAGIL